MGRTTFEDNYSFRIRIIFSSVVLVLAVTLFSFPRFQTERQQINVVTIEDLVEEIDIPETHQFEQPPPPSRPSIPVESELENYAEDITIEETELNEYAAWEVPPMPEDDAYLRVKFIPHEVPPKPIGGFAAIVEKLEYPPLAREAGIEGTVILQIFVSEKGFVEEVVVQKGIPETGLDEAAVKAVKQVRFEPALQRDLPVGVWVAIPIRFHITSNQLIN